MVLHMMRHEAMPSLVLKLKILTCKKCWTIQSSELIKAITMTI